MLSGFDSSCMVSVFPESALAFLSPVVFLCRSSGDQPNRVQNSSTFAVIFQKQMDEILGHNIVQNDQSKRPFDFKEPMNPTVAVLLKFQ
jgi:hypothetical protein